MSSQRPSQPETEGDTDTEWRFSIDEVGPDAEADEVEADPIEPEEISLEHASFVALGVAIALGVLLTAL